MVFDMLELVICFSPHPQFAPVTLASLFLADMQVVALQQREGIRVQRVVLSIQRL